MTGFIPPGYQAVMMGAAGNIESLNAFVPLEAGTAEGSLIILELDFAESPTGEQLAQLNQALTDRGVAPWPGYDCIVFADEGAPTVYLAWQKGMAWMAIIVGMLAVTILPALLGAVCWLILPQSLKDLITGISEMGMMLAVMWLMSTMMKPLVTTEKAKKSLTEVKSTPELKEAAT